MCSVPADPAGDRVPVGLRDVADRLDAERTALRGRLAAMEDDMVRLHSASLDSNADDEHDPEGQTIAYERSQLAALTDVVRAHLAELEAATRRVADGTWGRCEVCGDPIPMGRLDARPTARTCVRHAQRASGRPR